MSHQGFDDDDERAGTTDFVASELPKGSCSISVTKIPEIFQIENLFFQEVLPSDSLKSNQNCSICSAHMNPLSLEKNFLTPLKSDYW